VQDVIVDPAHSDSGIATALVQRLLDRVAESATSDVFVGLFASPEAEGVYDELGFSVPSEMTGMRRAVSPAADR
jgi:GNAT superfamily N-acetyltransferase